MSRLPVAPTQRIDRSAKISFSYMSEPYQGLEGDTIATALFDQGIRIFSRSFKYHRPRGLYTLDNESSTTLMTVDGIPNVRAESTPLREGMKVMAQNCLGRPEFDLMAVGEKFAKFMPPGFYYKRFHKPYKLWPFFQNKLRGAAGLGKLNPHFPEDYYENVYLNAEVCIVGGGPAGMSAALAAAETGLRVVLIEARPVLGGFYDWRTAADGEGQPFFERGRALAAQVAKTADIRVFTSTTLIGFYANNHLTARQAGLPGDRFGERYMEVRAGSVVVATGCLERPLIFEHNERPGVMQANTAVRLARTYGLKPGQRAVLACGHDLGLEAALDLASLGVEVGAVADSRTEGFDEALVAALEKKKITFLPGFTAVEAKGGRGVTGAVLADLEGGSAKAFKADILVAQAGLTPHNAPLAMAKSKIAYDQASGYYLVRETPERVHAAGRILGLCGAQEIEASGALAGYKAAAEGGADVSAQVKEAEEALAGLPGLKGGSTIRRSPGPGKKAFVCFDEDVAVKDIGYAAEEGFNVIELSKRYTTIGMGPSQSGLSGVNFPLLLAEYLGQEPGSVPSTTTRSPFSPTLMATYAGPNHHMSKVTPLDKSQKELGGIFRLIGVWNRARYFSADMNPEKEIKAVRSRVGLIDVSTLGKFRLHGPDSLKALQRMYVSDMSKMVKGKLKYSAMCNEDGCVIDDGVVAKIGENDYYFTTSTARAGQTVEWFRYHTRHEGWDFNLVNMTDGLGAINLAGPLARQVLAKVTEADVSNEAVPYMAYQEIKLKGGIPARLLRVGFVGEMGFELHVPSSWTQAVWDLLWEAGQEHGIAVFGLEAQSCLRLDKGHVIIGADTELRLNLHDLGLSFLLNKDKEADYTVGVAALNLAQKQEGRLKLVGFKTDVMKAVPKDGSIIVNDGEVRGHVTSCRFSHSLDRTIGLAFVEDKCSAVGSKLEMWNEGMESKEPLIATVIKPPFYDPKGNRLKM